MSYRAGRRWALDAIELEHLAVLGYRIDSSVPPGIDFRDRSGLRALGPDFRRHLCAGPAQPYRAGPLWEVPVSITPAGLFGAGAVGAGVARLAGGRGPADQISRWAYPALDATGLHRLVWVRPLKHPRSLLVAAARSMSGVCPAPASIWCSPSTCSCTWSRTGSATTWRRSSGCCAIAHYGDKRKPVAAENPGFSDMDRARMESLLGIARLGVLDHDDEVMCHSNIVVLEK